MANPNQAAPGRWPGPYINDCKVDNSVMEYVPFDVMDIGARKSGLATKSEVKNDTMSITHVGGQAGKGG